MKTQATYFQESEDLAEAIELQKQIAVSQLLEIQSLSFSHKRKAIEWAKEKLSRPVYKPLRGTVSKKLRQIFETFANEDEQKAYMSVTGTINSFLNNCL